MVRQGSASEAELVEALFHNMLMAADFWTKALSSKCLRCASRSPRVPTNLP